MAHPGAAPCSLAMCSLNFPHRTISSLLFSLLCPQLVWVQPAIMSVHDRLAAKLLLLCLRFSRRSPHYQAPAGDILGMSGLPWRVCMSNVLELSLGTNCELSSFALLFAACPFCGCALMLLQVLELRRYEVVPVDCCIVPFAPRIREGLLFQTPVPEAARFGRNWSS